jgi:hypothetical protein
VIFNKSNPVVCAFLKSFTKVYVGGRRVQKRQARGLQSRKLVASWRQWEPLAFQDELGIRTGDLPDRTLWLDEPEVFGWK